MHFIVDFTCDLAFKFNVSQKKYTLKLRQYIHLACFFPQKDMEESNLILLLKVLSFMGQLQKTVNASDVCVKQDVFD